MRFSPFRGATERILSLSLPPEQPSSLLQSSVRYAGNSPPKAHVPQLRSEKDPVTIPKQLRAQQVRLAIEQIEVSGVPPHRRSHRYCLDRNGRHFPPKYVVSLAGVPILGHELPSVDFSGGDEVNRRLVSLGFTVIPGRCGGTGRAVQPPAAPI